MKASRWNPRLRGVYMVPALLSLHLGLRYYLASHDVISSIFAVGPHTSALDLLLVATFVIARLAVILLLPTLLAWHATRWLLQRRRSTH